MCDFLTEQQTFAIPRCMHVWLWFSNVCLEFLR